MSTGKKQQQVGKKATAPKKPRKKPGNFTQFWNKLLKRDKKSGPDSVPTERTVKRAVAKVAKNMHLNKSERQQVTQVLAAEVQQRSHEKKGSHRPTGQAKPGESAYPGQVQTSMFPEQQKSAKSSEEAANIELIPIGVDVSKISKKSVSDLEMQRKSFMEKSGKGGSSISASLNTSSKSQQSWSQASFGAQPTSISLEESAVTEIASHTLVHMLQQMMLDAAVSRREMLNVKKPEDMNPDELIDLRRRNPNAWDNLVRENTVVSYALCKPTENDIKHAEKTKEKTHGVVRKPLTFDEKIEVTKAPVGKDFHQDEKKAVDNNTLKRI